MRVCWRDLGQTWSGAAAAPWRARRGLTLLEVLIAIFVLAIGLLGVAALIPVGRFQLEQGAKQDRAAAVGRAAWREVEVRGMLDPTVWINWEGAIFGRAVAPWDGTKQTTPFAWVDVDEPTQLASPLPLVDFMPDAPAPNWGMAAWGSLTPTPPLPYRPLGPLGRGNSICIDPYFLASNQEPAGNTFIRTFPYVLNSDPDMDSYNQPIGNDDWPNPPRMERVSLNLDPNRLLSELPGGAPVLAPYFGRDTHLMMARRLFVWHDDLSFGQSNNPGQRAIWSVSRDATGQIVEHTAAGEYSWMVTVTPAAQQTKPQLGVQMDYSVTPPAVASLPFGIVAEHTSATAQELYTVSVVVFHRRDVSFVSKHEVPRQGEWLVPPAALVPGARPAPPERMVYCDFLGTGRGGGDVRLRLRPSPILLAQRNRRRPDRSDFPPVVVGQWIMVCGWQQPDLEIGSGTPPTDVTMAIGGVWDPLNPAFPPNRQAVFRWYRVAAVDALTPYPVSNNSATLVDEWYQDVTLVGPDWDPNQFLDADNVASTTAHGSYSYALNTSSRTCYAALIKGVVAVYEKTIALDEF